VQTCESARHTHKHALSPAYTAARASSSGSLSFSELSEGLHALKNNNGPAFTRLRIDEVRAVSHPVLRKAAPREACASQPCTQAPYPALRASSLRAP
jgi:hypothetical protein